MANTYTQIHIHAVFAVRYREALILPSWKDQLYRYMTGIIQNQGHKLLIINGMSDHVHLLFGMRASQSLSELMQQIKGDSSEWINQQGLTRRRFSWQEGYGGFSYSKSQVPAVAKYIENQEIHHQKKTFREEYLDILKAFEVEFEERFVFKEVE